VVAVEDGLEGSVVPAPYLLDQAVVPEGGEHSRRAGKLYAAGRPAGSGGIGLHGAIMVALPRVSNGAPVTHIPPITFLKRAR
jgi:hypothetical protein